MHLLIVLIIICVAVVAVTYTYRESFDTRRPIGEHLPPGVAKYWDGEKTMPCTACPERRVCPTCPQYMARSIEQFSGAVMNFDEGNVGDSHVGLLGSKPVMTSSGQILSDGMTFNDGTGVILTSGGDVVSTSTVELVNDTFPYDMQMVAESSTIAPGGCVSNRNWSRFSDVSNLGTRNDDIFDGDRSIGVGSKCQRSDYSTLNLLYKDVMELDTSCEPSAVDCEFIGDNGYLYKEDCGIW